MSAHRPVVAPAAVAGVTALMSSVTVLLAWRNGADPLTFLDGHQASTWLAGLAFGVVAALVLRAQPANRLGGLLAAVAVLAGGCGVANEYATYALRTRPGSLPGAGLAVWCGAVLWLPAFLLLLVGFPLLFPAGRLPSPRWRWPARVAAFCGVLATVCLATAGYGVGEAFPEVRNPFDVHLPDPWVGSVALAAFFITVAVGVLACAGIVARMRRVDTTSRRQHAWFVAALGVGLAVGLLSLPDAVTFAGNALVVAALGMGIVRHGCSTSS